MVQRTTLTLLLGLGCLACGAGARYFALDTWPTIGAEDPICYDDRCRSLHPVALEVLQPSCSLLDASGAVVGEVEGNGTCGGAGTNVTAPGARHLRISMRCNDDVLIELPESGRWYIDGVRAAATPSRRYLREGQAIAIQNAEHWLHREHARAVELPVNTVVEVLHGWPDETGACAWALVRIVDAGGADFAASEATSGPGLARVAGRIGWVRLDALSVEPVEGGSARDAVVADERARAEEAARIARALTEEEQRLGRCSDERHAALEAVLTRDVALARGLSGSDGVWDLVGHEYVVASTDATELTFRPTLGGEYHVVAVGVPPVTLEVFDRDRSSVTQTSPYEAVFAPSGTGASRLLVGRPREEFRVRVRGAGCTLVMAFARY